VSSKDIFGIKNIIKYNGSFIEIKLGDTLSMWVSGFGVPMILVDLREKILCFK